MPQHTPTDRITQLLTKNTPRIQDVAKAFLEASTGKKTYSDALNAQRAMEIEEAKTLYDVFSEERQERRLNRQLDLDESRLYLDQIKFNAEQKIRGQKEIVAALDKIASNPDAQAKIFQRAFNDPTQISEENAYQILSRMARDVEFEGTPLHIPAAPEMFRYNPETQDYEVNPVYMAGKAAELELTESIKDKYDDKEEDAGPFGDTERERYISILRDYDAVIRSGQPMPEQLAIDAAIAEDQLNKFTRSWQDTVTGAIEAYQPGVPNVLRTPSRLGGEAPPVDVPQPRTYEAAEPGVAETGVITLKPGAKGAETQQAAINLVDDILNDLEQARAAGEEITGILGTLKSKYGGLVRQMPAGADITTRAENLDRKLQELNFLLTPILTGERGKTISDYDRQRVEKITKGLSAFNDERSIIESLEAAIRIIERYGGSTSGNAGVR